MSTYTYLTMSDIMAGKTQGLGSSSTKFNIPQTVYDLPQQVQSKKYLETPFAYPIFTPEEAKVFQNPNNIYSR